MAQIFLKSSRVTRIEKVSSFSRNSIQGIYIGCVSSSKFIYIYIYVHARAKIIRDTFVHVHISKYTQNRLYFDAR